MAAMDTLDYAIPSPSAPASSSSLPSLAGTFPSFSSAAWGLFQSAEQSAEGHPLMDEQPRQDGGAAAFSVPGAGGDSAPAASGDEAQQTASTSPFSQPSGPHYRRVSSQEVATSLEGLRILARQGSWRAIVEKVKAAKKGSSLEQHLAFQAYHVLSLLKLRMYGAAADELRALGSLDSPEYRYESHPQLFLGKTGSMVPFALRWLHAELPLRMGRIGSSIERLYSLLDYCNRQIDILSGQASDADSLAKGSDDGLTVVRSGGRPGAPPVSTGGGATSSGELPSSGAGPSEHFPGHLSPMPPLSDRPPPSPPPPSASDQDGDVAVGGGASRESWQPTGRSSQEPASAADILEGLLSGTSLGSSFLADGRMAASPMIQEQQLPAPGPLVGGEKSRQAAEKHGDDEFSDLSGGGTPKGPCLGKSGPDNLQAGRGFEGVFELGELSPADDSENLFQFRESDSEARAPATSSDVDRKSEPHCAEVIGTKDVVGNKEQFAGCRRGRGLVERWRRRHEAVLHAVISLHMGQRDFLVVLQWLEWLARRRPWDFELLSKYGLVQLQMGDLQGAQATFTRVEALANANNGGVLDRRTKAFLFRNRGLLLFALKRYAAALVEFNGALAEDPTDHVAANNKALCLMYSRDLVGAIAALEEALQSGPLSTLNETLVLNLCSMYELAAANSAQTKRTLSSWLARLAPDDFDLMCTRL